MRKRGRAEGRGKGDRAMHVKNYTFAYISPATSGVILAISRRWEPEPGREFFLSFRAPSLSSRMLFSAQLSRRRHVPLREEHSLMLYSARWVISGPEPGEKCYNCYVYRFEKLLVATWEQIAKRNRNFLLYIFVLFLRQGGNKLNAKFGCSEPRKFTGLNITRKLQYISWYFTFLR